MERNRQIIYQLAPRTFTPEGTLKAAAALLPHVADLGVDIVYLCPVFVAENDPDEATWSPRQKASATNNPKNPYKMADYFNVDPEYGTNEDLKAFVASAHALGLKVLFDLVYLHCGRGAVFLKDHPDFIERNEDGSDVIGERWPFARLNYKNPDLRAYLAKNVEYLIREFDVDGFRCDVGDRVPLDFWESVFCPIKERNPDFITLNEGRDPAYLAKAFDWGYGFEWASTMRHIFRGEEKASALRARWEEEKKLYGEATCRLLRSIDNHDTASDIGLLRNEVVMTSRGVEAALVVTNTFEGIAFLWNGYELCDNAENNMFSNRDHGRRSAMNWSRAFTAEGRRRMEIVRKLHELHHANNGSLEWLENDLPDDVISYRCGVSVVVNTRNTPVTVRVDGDFTAPILQSGAAIENGTVTLEPYGYIIAK